MKQSDIDRFWSNVTKTEGCWLWTAGVSNGYGMFYVRRRHRKASRVAWEISNGAITEGDGFHGTCVLHKCDNRLCVNPEHLFLGSNKDNVDDMVSKGRCLRASGESHGSATLDKLKVAEIRSNPDRLSQRKLAKKFGVSQMTIWKIINNKNWI